jgi:hypothetical protein
MRLRGTTWQPRSRNGSAVGLGLFITGPLGYLAGAGLGLWYGLRRAG